MSENLKLFNPQSLPLAEEMRPKNWQDFEGVANLDANLMRQIQSAAGKPPSLILWGPPGSGKTTFAKLVGKSFRCEFIEISAVLAGVKEIRDIVAQAKKSIHPTILFVDEIHRFNRAQQDAFLPHVENGTIILIGATTENPSFYLNAALLSRAKVITFKSHSDESLKNIIRRSVDFAELKFSAEAEELIVGFAGGDARKLLNLIEALKQSALVTKEGELTFDEIKGFIHDSKVVFYDRSGEEHYNVISAFIKSMRGSNPDAALYWGFRMLEAGEDPLFVIRRMIIFASEDIGNADPRALQVAVATNDAFERLGLPEGRIPIAQCITYLASAPKSNRSYKAMHKAIEAVTQTEKIEVPMHLRNAPTKLMKSLGYGDKYLYPHEEEGAFAVGVEYLPEKLKNARFYEPSDRGYEKNIKERLDFLKNLK